MTEHFAWLAHLTLRSARKLLVGIIGGTVLLLGLVLLVTPGPAFVVIPVGLGILALEFAWARHWLHRLTGGRAGTNPQPPTPGDPERRE